MRLISIILSFAILFAGCYTNTPLTKDSPPSSAEVSFRLKDGAYILSNEYQRVENGYKVIGKLVNKENKNSRDFSGIVSDEQIKEVVSKDFDTVKTVGSVVLVVGVLSVAGYLVFRADMKNDSFGHLPD